MSESTGVLTWDPERARSRGPSGGRSTASRSASPTTARCWPGARTCSPATSTTRRPRPRPSRTAGCTPATSASSTSDGYLRIVDRKKELIITAGGENVSPANLEAALATVPLIGQACVVGDRQRFPAAIVTLDPDYAPQWAARHGHEGESLAELAAEPDVHAEIQRGIDEVNERFTRAYQIKKFTVVPDEWLPNSDAADADVQAEAPRRRGPLRRPRSPPCTASR